MKKFNAGTAHLKRAFGGLSRDRLAMAAVAILFVPAAASAGAWVPVPQPRPIVAPASDGKDGMQASKAAPATPETPPAPSACRLALTDAVAIAPSVPAITGPGACGGDDLVRLEAVVLADRSRVPVKPAATLRCSMASAIADWIRTDMASLAEGLGSHVSELDNFDSFECRGRNRVAGAKLSEHGRANALDIRAIRLANGRTIALTDRNVPHELRETMMKSACMRFTTVLGPGSDGYHEDHIHLDLAERRNGYRICQWGIDDPMPAVAPLLPAERPAEASPRETAEEKSKASEALDEHVAASRAVSPSAVPAASLPTQVVPQPRRRPAAANAEGKTGSPNPSLSASRPSTRLSTAKPVKRKRRHHSDLPPFLRPLFD
jgi:hypothetical protein